MSPCHETNDDSFSDTNLDEEIETNFTAPNTTDNDFQANNTTNEEMGYTPLVDLDASDNYQPIMFSVNDANTVLEEEEDDDDIVDNITLANDALRRLDEEYQSVVQSAALRSNVDHEPSLAYNQEYHDNDCNVENAVEESNTNENTVEERKIANIDTNAVLKAIESIRLRSPKLTQNLDLHSQNIPLPIHHPIIPRTPLTAFHRTTPKAMEATANLSRSASIAECVSRLDLLKKSLSMHVIGVDDIKECTGPESIQKTFCPFVRWMSSFPTTEIDIILCGPTIPTNLHQKVLPLSGSVKANATCIQQYYHDYLQQNNTPKPDLILFFNPGLWGYESWQPTLQYIADTLTNIPLVITSYTIKEAEEDYDVVNSFKKSDDSTCVIWDVQVNPFHSKKKRNVATAPGEDEYYDNYAWQCWKF